MKLIVSIWQYLTILVLRVFLTVFAGFKIDGRYFLEVINGPVIFIANHRSKLDPYILSTAIPFKFHKNILPFRFATTITYMKKPLLRPWLKLWGCFAIAPRSGSLEEVLKPALKILKFRDQSMVYFPEGKIVKAGEHRSARPGVAYLAKHSKWLIIPVGVNGSNNLSFIKFFTFKKRVSVHFGQPFYYHEIASPDEDLVKVAQRMMERVNKLVNEERVPTKEFSYAKHQ